jgi:putative PIN family toxin of toxin-antitoxin system
VIKVTLDANTLTAGAVGLRNLHSTPGELIRSWRAGRFRLVLSEHLLGETERTLTKPYFRVRLNHAEVAQFVGSLAIDATIVPLTVTVQGVASHPEDDLVLATALSGHADYLVTGDRHLLRLGSYEGVIIVTPRDFLATLGGL